MSGNGMGGEAYDAFIGPFDRAVDFEPDVLIADSSHIIQLEEEMLFDNSLQLDGRGYVGHLLGISLWMDDRFDKPVFISRHD